MDVSTWHHHNRMGYTVTLTEKSTNSVLSGVIQLLLVMLLFGMSTSSIAQPPPPGMFGADGVSNKDPGADLWRAVRQRDGVNEGISQVKSVDSGVLINPLGDQWMRFRMEMLSKYGLYMIAGVILLVVLFYLIRGRVNIEGGLSGFMIKRFTHYERSLHWVMAVVFLFLALTGLILLWGRDMLIPLFGHEIFSILASASKEGHNLFGPLFAISVVLMFIRFVRRNIYEKGDLTWLLKGGGFIGKSHVTGGFFNMGEKTWYWIFILVGLAISLSGFVLLFPNFGQGRVIMEGAHVVHGVGSVILMTIAVGHMYLGSVGTEGSLEAMRTGYVDIKWAEAHHDRWAKSCHDNNLVLTPEEFANLQGKSVEDFQVMQAENQ